MRGLAVTMVVLYHVGMPGFAGGFVGVDVFFVISGYLITGLLTRELVQTGRISLATFYARRIRRLLPAAALVAVATFALARLVLPPLSLLDLRRDVLATLSYLSNYWFAVRNTDYLQGHLAASPYQQYWSLAVEEQFYLVWPALLIGATLLLRRLTDARTAGRIAVGAVAVGSFALCVVVTVDAQPWAFFGLPTRAWELAAGGLVALTLGGGARAAGRPAGQVVGLLGLAVVLVTPSLLAGRLDFPGWAAAVPVGGAVALIASGCVGRGPLQAVLGWRGLTLLGALSYSIYLWHWPFLVLAEAAHDGPLSWAARLGVLAATVLAAWLTYLFVEQPLRHQAWLSRRPRRTVGFGAAATVGAAGLALLLAVPPALHLDRPAQTVALAGAQTGAEPDRWTTYVPDNLRPPLRRAGDDFPVVFRDGCHSGFRDVEVHDCVYGKPDAAQTVVLFGDSHAAQWFPPLRAIAEARGLRLVSLTKSGCPTAEVTKYTSFFLRDYWECTQWRHRAIARIVAEKPALVLVANGTNATGRDRVPDDKWWAGMNVMFDRLGPVRNVTVLADTPYADGDVPVCLSAHLSDATACAVQRSTGINLPFTRAEAALVQRRGGRYLDLNDHICGPRICPAIIGDILVYIDRHHLSPEVTTWLREPLDQYVAAHVRPAGAL
ncbi:acyltransferase family protein [Micromonospora sp. NPDC051300]|uniref:acyltransferase family protein n=1 Tax=Micromonospora sp. NPDC051300 TaxID=3364286 RepID=UPI00379E52F2